MSHLPARSARVCALAALLSLQSVSAAQADKIFKEGFETPISVTADSWSWVPFDDAYCGDGSTVGIGVNPSSTGTRVLIYLEGGGACYDNFTCYVGNAAANFGGYSQAQFSAESTSTGYLARQDGFFDRTSATNPFKDYSFVFVPYCTGDVHSGNSVVTIGSHTAHFVGFNNMTAFLNRLYPTFRSTDRVVIAGSSAGGFGALFNWWQTRQAFGNIRVDMIDDSGTLMPPDILANGNGSDATEQTVWNVAATRPQACSGCAGDIETIFDFYSGAFPDSRGTLLSYTADSVLPTYFGISAGKFTQGLNELEANQFGVANTNLAYFNYSGSGHVLFFNPPLTVGSTSLLQFISAMESDDPTWQSVH